MEAGRTRVLDAQLLIEAVGAAVCPGRTLVSASQIVSWCTAHDVDCGAALSPPNKYLWAADEQEARGRHRLQRFRHRRASASTDVELVSWCLLDDLVVATLWARMNGWEFVRWDAAGRRWDHRDASAAGPGTRRVQ